MYGEVNHPERGPLVRALNAATEASAGLMYAIAALIVIFGVIMVVFSFGKPHTIEDRAMQNGFYEVRLPDATDYWTEMVKCRHACPVHTDACGYVTAIAEGQLREGVPHRARAQSVRVHLRAGLRRALRDQLPPRRRGRAGRHPRRSSASSPTSSAPKPATTRCYREANNDRMLPPNRGRLRARRGDRRRACRA